MKKICLFLIVLLSCSTPYQRMGFAGGYEDQYLGNEIYMITVSVNSYTSKSTAYNYFHKRANEITKENGYVRYEVIEIMSSDRKGLFYYDGGTKVQPTNKPEIFGRIRCFKE